MERVVLASACAVQPGQSGREDVTNTRSAASAETKRSAPDSRTVRDAEPFGSSGCGDSEWIQATREKSRSAAIWASVSAERLSYLRVRGANARSREPVFSKIDISLPSAASLQPGGAVAPGTATA